MKRTALAFILILVIALSAATWLVHTQISELQSQNSELQDQVNELEDQNKELQEQLRELEDSIEGVRILGFEWTGSGGPGAVGIQWARNFNITLQNLGNSAVEGLSVDVKQFVNGDELWSSTGLYGPGIIGYTAEYGGYDGKLNPGETREIRGVFLTRLDILGEYMQVWDEVQKTVSVRVMMNETVLDELLLPLT